LLGRFGLLVDEMAPAFAALPMPPADLFAMRSKRDSFFWDLSSSF
jgi:hypothetical protein